VRLSDHRDLIVAPQVASEDMVLHTPQAVGWRSLAAPSEEGPPVPIGWEGLATIKSAKYSAMTSRIF